MRVTKAVVFVCFLLCSQIKAQAASAHTIKGVVVTPDGTVVRKFSVVIRHDTDKPELVRREHFNNGEFTIDRLEAKKYQIQIASPEFIGAKLIFDFKARPRAVDYCIIVLHPYRSDARLQPGASYTVSAKVLAQQIPDAAREAYKKAVDYHRDGNLESALIEYGKALRAFPQYVAALSDVSTIFLLYNRPETALAFLRRAQAVDDCNSIVNLNIAVALTEQGDYGGALKLLRNILTREPNMALAQYAIAKIHYIQRKYETAEEFGRLAVATDPLLLDAWVLLVKISVDTEKFAEARQALEHVRETIGSGTVRRFIDEQLSTLGNQAEVRLAAPASERSNGQTRP
jgi:tetratricopeptide (TPR) repeat protein